MQLHVNGLLLRRPPDPGVPQGEPGLPLHQQGDDDGPVLPGGDVGGGHQRVQQVLESLLKVLVVKQPEGLGQLDQGRGQAEGRRELDLGTCKEWRKGRN